MIVRKKSPWRDVSASGLVNAYNRLLNEPNPDRKEIAAVAKEMKRREDFRGKDLGILKMMYSKAERQRDKFFMQGIKETYYDRKAYRIIMEIRRQEKLRT